MSQPAIAGDRHDLLRTPPAPKPIPGGTQIPGGPLLHIFLPGPTNVTLPFTGLTLEGLNVEPSTITDFNGFTALAYIVGSARASDGRTYNMEVDLRVFEGRYVGETGSRHEGTFAMIWIDLFEPGSGAQVHDFSGGIPPSGLFWVVPLRDSAFFSFFKGQRARVRADDVPVIDTFQILGPNQIPATVSFEIEWEATGPAVQLGSGKSVPPTDPAAFLGEFAPAFARGSFSGQELGFSFQSNPGATSQRGYAELGPERNGVFL
jgi:hypothetical protein